MRKLALFACLTALALSLAPPAHAAPCGLPEAQPWWIDYASGAVSFRYWIFGKPGVIAATEGGPTVPKTLRRHNARTVYWEMKLGSLVGTPTNPADADAIAPRARRVYEKAVDASGGCGDPVIALNELFGASTTTPWSTTNAKYRANVLTLLRELSARGARPFLLLASAPYTGGAAADWWREAAQYGDLLPEVYFRGPAIYKQGAIAGSRYLRRKLRQAVRNFTSLGIPASRVGFVLGFQSQPGGRAGLQPARAWYEVVKWEALAAKQVAKETGIASVWSWGWGTFSADKSGDAEKKIAACVYLWARDPALCDAVAAAGEEFNASLTEGQLALPEGVQCTYEGRTIRTAELDALAAVTGDREVAATVLMQRLVELEEEPVTQEEVSEAERTVIEVSFAGSRSAYHSALARARATPALARSIIADRIRRGRIEQELPVAEPTAAAVARFYASYPNELIRRFAGTPSPWWLRGRPAGYALRRVAPARAFALSTGDEDTLGSAGHALTVKALTPPVPVGALPLGLVRPAIATALVSFARGDAFDRWAHARQAEALAHTICLRDDLPEVAVVDVAIYLPFLDLNF